MFYLDIIWLVLEDPLHHIILIALILGHLLTLLVEYQDHSIFPDCDRRDHYLIASRGNSCTLREPGHSEASLPAMFLSFSSRASTAPVCLK